MHKLTRLMEKRLQFSDWNQILTFFYKSEMWFEMKTLACMYVVWSTATRFVYTLKQTHCSGLLGSLQIGKEGR